MNKKVLMSTIALLALFIVTISPVRAIRKEPFESHVETESIDPGKQWISEEGILHRKGGYSAGPHEGTLGTGIEETWSTHWVLDLATGKGTFSGKWLVTFTPEDTIGGSYRGKITMGTGGFQFSGTFVATHGTGEFEGVKIMGSFEGVPLDQKNVADLWGTIIYP